MRPEPRLEVPSGGAGAVPRKGFNPYVHGARGLFSVMVFGFHVANSGWSGPDVPGAAAIHFAMTSLQYGVELFFGISGFVIIGALERAPSVVLFAWDRFTRIYPVLWATIAAIVMTGVVAHQPWPPARTLLLNIVVPPPFVTIVPMNPPAWSLSWEILFYVLCALGFAMRRSRPAVAAIVMIGLAVVVVFPRTMLMLPGLMIATGRMRMPPVRTLACHPAACLMLFLLAWHGMGMLAGGTPNRISPASLPVAEWLAFLPAVAAIALLGTAALAGIVNGAGWLGRLLAGRLMRWLGTISYSFYLWHPIALAGTKIGLHVVAPGVRTSAFGQLALAACGLPIALSVAWASQVLIEARLTRWLRQAVGEPRRDAAVTTASANEIAPVDSDVHSPVHGAGDHQPATGAA